MAQVRVPWIKTPLIMVCEEEEKGLKDFHQSIFKALLGGAVDRNEEDSNPGEDDENEEHTPGNKVHHFFRKKIERVSVKKKEFKIKCCFLL